MQSQVRPGQFDFRKKAWMHVALESLVSVAYVTRAGPCGMCRVSRCTGCGQNFTFTTGPTATHFIPWSHTDDVQSPDAFLKRGGIRCDRHYNYTDTEKDIAHVL